MTVQELIAQLQKCDPSASVVIHDADTDLGLMDLAVIPKDNRVELFASYAGPIWENQHG